MSDASNDPWRLERFVTAQDRGGTYRRAVAELRAGAKVSHWMWFIFPQVAGLGMSAMSREYAISSAQEARAYLAHPVLGPRLRECARVVADTEGRTAEQVFGYVDAMKLRSSMTLFAAATGDTATGDAATGGAATGAPGATVFREVLDKYFGGVPDEETLARLPRLDLRDRGQPPPEALWPAFPFDHTFELRHNGSMSEAGSGPELPSRWAGVAETLPPSFGQLTGPGGGMVELPHDLAWSGRRNFDLANPVQRYMYHMTVLTSGITSEHFTSWLNGDLLRSDWSRLGLPQPLRRVWEAQFPELSG